MSREVSELRGEVMMGIAEDAHKAGLAHLTGTNLNIMEILYGLIDTCDRKELQFVLYPALIKACAFSEEFAQKLREAFGSRVAPVATSPQVRHG